MYSTNAVRRAPGELMKGSAAMKGAARIRPAVIVLGRFTGGFPAPLGERLQHQLAHGFQCVEHAISVHGYRFEVGRLLDPLPARKLLDEILAGMIRIGSDTTLAGILNFPPRIESGLQ